MKRIIRLWRNDRMENVQGQYTAWTEKQLYVRIETRQDKEDCKGTKVGRESASPLPEASSSYTTRWPAGSACQSAHEVHTRTTARSQSRPCEGITRASIAASRVIDCEDRLVALPERGTSKEG